MMPIAALGRAKSPDASYDAALFGDSMAAQWEPLLGKVSQSAFARNPLPKTRYRDKGLGSTYAALPSRRRMVKVLRDRGVKVHSVGAMPVIRGESRAAG